MPGKRMAVAGAPTAVEKSAAADRKRITHALLLGLPGTTDDATPAGLRRELAEYAGIGGATLKRNLLFLVLCLMAHIIPKITRKRFRKMT